MKIKTQMLLISALLFTISGICADKTDWYTNMTPPLHAFMGAWFGFTSFSLGILGTIMISRFLYVSFNDRVIGLSRY